MLSQSALALYRVNPQSSVDTQGYDDCLIDVRRPPALGGEEWSRLEATIS